MTEIDWHNADIIAALRKRGTSLARLSRDSGLASPTLANVLYRPWPKGEWLIAIALGIHPSTIWPSRYHNGDKKHKPRKPFTDILTQKMGKIEACKDEVPGKVHMPAVFKTAF